MSRTGGRGGYDLTVALNYYAPYVSGLTETARVVAEGLAARGWRVAVVAARHDRSLPAYERRVGVDVYRCAVAARLSKGVVSPSLPVVAARLARRSRVLNLHLPMLEAGPIALAAGPTPVVVTYQCDVNLAPTTVNRAITAALDRSTRAAVGRSATTVVSSLDYARSSRVAAALADRSVEIAPPATDRTGGVPSFREAGGLSVGFLGRIVEEKGLEYLVQGFRALDDPDARLLVGGDHERVAGGSVVDRVRAAAGDDGRVRLLGFVPDGRLADFYASLDAFVLPSVNSLEAFGIVQVEAMLAGVPVVATDLPGVRTPVARTGFGVVVPPRDPAAIRDALRRLAGGPRPVPREGARPSELYGRERTLDAYERVLAAAARPAGGVRSPAP